MAERIELTTPIPAAPRWFVQSLTVRRGMSAAGGVITPNAADSQITVALLAENGQVKVHDWTGATADALIVSLNKINLTPPNTLNKRILDRLIADGVILGVSAGTAD